MTVFNTNLFIFISVLFVVFFLVGAHLAQASYRSSRSYSGNTVTIMTTGSDLRNTAVSVTTTGSTQTVTITTANHSVTLTSSDSSRGMQLDFSDICTAQPGCRVTGDGNCTCNPPPPPPPPPTVSISAVINDDSENEHTGTTDIYVLPIDTVEINWSSQDATSCQGQFDLQGHVNDTEGSYTLDLDEITPGETRQYQVSCTRTVGHQPSAPGTSGTISVTLLGLDLNLSLDREIIRAGETVTMDWDVSFPDGAEATAHGNNLPDTLDCDLAGAIRQEIDIQANPNGSATSGPIFNFFNNRLRCVYPDSVHEFSVTTPLEVIPAPRER